MIKHAKKVCHLIVFQIAFRVSWENMHVHSDSVWIVSIKAWNNSYVFQNKHDGLWLLMSRITFIVNHIININLLLGNLSRFKFHLTRLVSFFNIFFPSLFCLMLFKSIQPLRESIYVVNFVRKISLCILSYILVSPPNSTSIESFTSILSFKW